MWEAHQNLILSARPGALHAALSVNFVWPADSYSVGGVIPAGGTGGLCILAAFNGLNLLFWLGCVPGRKGV